MDHVRIAQHARAHRGVFDQRFLDTLGVGSAEARRQVLAGRWRRVHEGVYVAAATPDSFELLAEAALAAIPTGALSLRTAGFAHDLGLDELHLDLSVEPGTSHRLAGVRIHQTPLPSHHVVRRSGWRVTSVDRTLVDLGKVLPMSSLQRAIEDAVIARKTTLSRIETTFGELAGRGRPGIARTRSVLARLDPEPPTESELESMFWRLLLRHRLDLPQRQASFEWLGRGTGRVDFWYPDARLVVELDGRRFHLRAAAFEADRRRDQLGLLEGVTTVRFTHRQVSTEAAFVAHVVRRLLDQRTSAPRGR